MNICTTFGLKNHIVTCIYSHIVHVVQQTLYNKSTTKLTNGV